MDNIIKIDFRRRLGHLNFEKLALWTNRSKFWILIHTEDILQRIDLTSINSDDPVWISTMHSSHLIHDEILEEKKKRNIRNLKLIFLHCCTVIADENAIKESSFSLPSSNAANFRVVVVVSYTIPTAPPIKISHNTQSPRNVCPYEKYPASALGLMSPLPCPRPASIPPRYRSVITQP